MLLTEPKPARISRDEALRRWPRLTAHLICQSLGYFTPGSAANAIAAYRNGVSFACEWYCDMIMCRTGKMSDEASLLQIGRVAMSLAFKGRRHHGGYMTDYRRAIALVRRAAAVGAETAQAEEAVAEAAREVMSQ